MSAGSERPTPDHAAASATTAAPAGGPELSVLIVNYNTWLECAGAVRSLMENPPTRPDGSPMRYECIVVDNLSPRRPEPQIQKLRDALAALCEDQRQ